MFGNRGRRIGKASQDLGNVEENGQAEIARGSVRSDSPVDSLRIVRYRLAFEAIEELDLPPLAGSTWRGAFGRALRGLSCEGVYPSCADCPRIPPCSYTYLFETPRPAGATKMRLYARVPHPFVLDPEKAAGAHPPGDVVSLGTTLVGRGADYAAAALAAFSRAAERGLGRNRGRLRLSLVEQEVGPGSGAWRAVSRAGDRLGSTPARPIPVPPCPERAMLRLVLPLRLKEADRNVRPETFRFHHLFRNLLRRISMLSTFHTEEPLDVDFAGLVRSSRDVCIDDVRLDWRDWRRFSGRQNTYLCMGGLVGSFTVHDDRLAEFWPYLWVGQFLHAGKGTSMGLGKFRIE